MSTTSSGLATQHVSKHFVVKEKFDIALSRIGDEIDKDQKEQDEMQFS